mgnify:FL=1
MKLFSSGRPANGVPAVAVVGLALLGVAGPPGMAPCLGAQDVEQWTVEAPPDLVIGEAEGDEAYLFMNVLDATTLSDGRVAIVEFYRGFFEVRWFDPQGRHMASAGRWGPGPFEFRSTPSAVTRLAGDSLFIVSRAFRFAVFGPRGRPGRSGRLPPIPAARPLVLCSDGDLVLLGSRPATGREVRGRPTEYETLFIAADTTSARADTFGIIGSRGMIGENGAFLHLPFEPEAVWAAGPNTTWFGSAASRTVQGLHFDGRRLTAVVRKEPYAVTRESRRRWQEFDLRSVSGELESQYRRHHRSVEYPDTMPVLAGLLVDRGDRLWAELYEPPYSTKPFRFEVFSPDGAPLAEVSVPFALLGPTARYGPFSSILEIGDDYLLVLRTDEWGVERVFRYRLSK